MRSADHHVGVDIELFVDVGDLSGSAEAVHGYKAAFESYVSLPAQFDASDRHLRPRATAVQFGGILRLALPDDHHASPAGLLQEQYAFLVYMPPPIPRCSNWPYSSLNSPSSLGLPVLRTLSLCTCRLVRDRVPLKLVRPVIDVGFRKSRSVAVVRMSEAAVHEKARCATGRRGGRVFRVSRRHHARRLLGGERSRDGGSLSRRQDAFNLGDRGRMPIFACLAGAVEKPANSFVRANTKPKSPKLEKELFFRAWGDYPSLKSLPESAFGRA
jgi:hypothetical protein